MLVAVTRAIALLALYGAIWCVLSIWITPFAASMILLVMIAATSIEAWEYKLRGRDDS